MVGKDAIVDEYFNKKIFDFLSRMICSMSGFQRTLLGIHFSMDAVEHVVKKMKIEKALGPDGIPLYVFQKLWI